MPKPLTTYTLTPIVPVICSDCNEDITRAQEGHEPRSMAEARQMAREHHRIWHPETTLRFETDRGGSR